MGTTYYYNHFSSIIKKGDKEFEEDSEEVDKKVKENKMGNLRQLCSKHRRGSRCFLYLPRPNKKKWI